MINRRELVQSIEVMKGQYIQAKITGDNKIARMIMNEIFRLDYITQEENIEEQLRLLEESKNAEIEFDIMEEEALNQSQIEARFSNQLKKIVKAKENTTNRLISDRQAETIRNGMRDRVGIDITEKQIAFINKLNNNQASEIIRMLSGISFYHQRVMLTKAIEIFKKRDDFAMIIVELKQNIHKKAWFDANEDLMRMSAELEDPTDAQIRRIADVAKYEETRYTLKNDFGIDVDDYEQRPEGKMYYVFNYKALQHDIKNKFNKESASNFIQTYDYISNMHEGNKLEKDQRNTLRGLYMQLGEYEKTKMTYLTTINKSYYDYIVKDLDTRVRLNKVANNTKDSRVIEAMKENRLIKMNKFARPTRSIALKQEEEEAKEMCNFVFGIYSCIGQEVPEEMSRILPYFVQRGESAYATIEECHYQEFRKLVFEQRALIREIDPSYNWGAMIANQPLHILKALGLDIMM